MNNFFIVRFKMLAITKTLIIVLYATVSVIQGCGFNHTAVIEFKENAKKFIINKGQKFETVFDFLNTGNTDLKIQNVTASCGCTSVNFSKINVAPGKIGHIKVTYDNVQDNYKIGEIERYLLVETNTKPILHILHLHGIITKAM